MRGALSSEFRLPLNHEPPSFAGLDPATPNRNAQSKNNRGGRDKPGHDLAGEAGYFRLIGILSKARE